MVIPLNQVDVLERENSHEGEKVITSDFYRRDAIYTTLRLFERL